MTRDPLSIPQPTASRAGIVYIVDSVIDLNNYRCPRTKSPRQLLSATYRALCPAALTTKRSFLLAISLVGLAALGCAQQRVEPENNRTDSNRDLAHRASGQEKSADNKPIDFSSQDYVLGPGDRFSLTVTELDDQYADKTFRIEPGGDVTIALAGRIHAAGLTTHGLELEIDKNLSKILKQPEAVVTILGFASQPVSIFGEVNTPGVHQVSGEKNLLQALSSAGGFTDYLGNTITISRSLKWGPVPLPGAHNDSTGQFSIATLSVKKLVGATNPANNIPVMPDDVISVSRTEVVYAVGSVNKPGGFQLNQQDRFSALQVISMAAGLTPTASPSRAIILREVPGTKVRSQIPVNVKQLLAGTATDVDLQADDILFIPNSSAKTITYRSIEAATQTVTGIAIFGRF